MFARGRDHSSGGYFCDLLSVAVRAYVSTVAGMVGALGWTRPSGFRPRVTVVASSDAAARAWTGRISMCGSPRCAEREEARRDAPGELLVFVEPGAIPSANFVSATVPFLARDSVSAVVTSKMAPSGWFASPPCGSGDSGVPLVEARSITDTCPGTFATFATFLQPLISSEPRGSVNRAVMFERRTFHASSRGSGISSLTRLRRSWCRHRLRCSPSIFVRLLPTEDRAVSLVR